MSVGFSITKTDLDVKMGLEVQAVWQALDAVRLRLLWLNDAARNSPYLTTTLGYTSGEETTLRAAFADLNKLQQISHAAAVQAATNDFFFNAKQLGGVGWLG